MKLVDTPESARLSAYFSSLPTHVADLVLEMLPCERKWDSTHFFLREAQLWLETRRKSGPAVLVEIRYPRSPAVLLAIEDFEETLRAAVSTAGMTSVHDS